MTIHCVTGVTSLLHSVTTIVSINGPWLRNSLGMRTHSTITEQEEPDTKRDNCERPEARQMQYISLAVCYCNQASCALFFGACCGLRVHPSEKAQICECGSAESG